MHFRPIRRVKNEIPISDAKSLLINNRRGALSVIGDNGYPYSIPINYYYSEEDNRIYFHSAKSGHKIDSIKTCDKVCFTTWDDGYLEEGDWAFHVSSCVVFGKAVLLEDEKSALYHIKKLAMKYYPTVDEIDDEIDKSFKSVQMIAIDIEHISGKKIHEK